MKDKCVSLPLSASLPVVVFSAIFLTSRPLISTAVAFPYVFFFSFSCHISFILLLVLTSSLEVWNNHSTDEWFKSFFIFSSFLYYNSLTTLCHHTAEGTDFLFLPKQERTSQLGGDFLSLCFCNVIVGDWEMRSVLLLCLDITKRKSLILKVPFIDIFILKFYFI